MGSSRAQLCRSSRAQLRGSSRAQLCGVVPSAALWDQPSAALCRPELALCHSERSEESAVHPPESASPRRRPIRARCPDVTAQLRSRRRRGPAPRAVASAKSRYSSQSARRRHRQQMRAELGKDVARHGQARRLRERGRAHPAGHAADLHDVGHREPAGTRRDAARHVVRSPPVLAELQRRAHRKSELRMAGVVVGTQRLLDPVEALRRRRPASAAAPPPA